jgi:2-hydroxychromene-2-carboxylate isomerase
MSRPIVDFWFEFASTYSYPAAMRVGALAHDAGIALRWRPFLLGPIFAAQGLTTSPFNIHAAKGHYMWRDVARTCAALGLPFRRPDPFPQASLLAARVALVGLEDGWGERFVPAVYQAQFAESLAIADRTVIGDLLRALDVDPGPVLARAQSDEIKSRLRAETDAAAKLGIFGAPSFVTADGELFWGNDRLEAALDWAKNEHNRMSHPNSSDKRRNRDVPAEH